MSPFPGPNPGGHGYAPPPLVAGPHAQTLVARLLRATAPSISYRRERIPTPDGDFLDLDHHPPEPPGAAVPTVLVLHGLEGCSRSGYVQTLCRALAARGLRSVALNFRGCSGEPNRTPRFYHSGETGDPALALRHLRDSRATGSLGVVGFSLGGNVLLKYLGEASTDAVLPDAAAAVSVPFDLGAAADHMARGAGRLYSSFFLRSLRRKVRHKARRFPTAYDVEGALAADTLREFDDAVTAPVHGFEDAEDYYRRASCASHLGEIRVPALLIHARDDPFVPASSIPDLQADGTARRLTPLLTGRGGHVGFLTASGGRLRPWAESRAADFLAERLG